MKIQINHKTDILGIIDYQNDFIEEGGLAVLGGRALLSVINALTEKFTRTFASQDWHPANHKSFASVNAMTPFSTIKFPYGLQTLWPDHCKQNTFGAEFVEGLNLSNCATIIRKGMNPFIDSYSAFFENDKLTPTGLTGYLREIAVRRLFLVGLARYHCVAYTALDAVAQGFEVYIIEDATAAIPDQFAGPDEQAATMTARLRRAGVNIIQSSDIE